MYDDEIEIEKLGTNPETFMLTINGEAITGIIHSDEASAVSEMQELTEDYDEFAIKTGGKRDRADSDAESDNEGWEKGYDY